MNTVNYRSVFPLSRSVRFDETISVYSMTAFYSTSIDLLLNPFVSSDYGKGALFCFYKKRIKFKRRRPSKFIQMIFAIHVKFAGTSFINTDSEAKLPHMNRLVYQITIINGSVVICISRGAILARGLTLSSLVSDIIRATSIITAYLSAELFSMYHLSDKRIQT